MIDQIAIQGFRCFKSICVPGCRRINVIVGDNGSGKTALLEALFLTLSGNVEVSVRLRAQRGLDATFSGPPRTIEEAIWREYFHDLDWRSPINIKLTGHGASARSLKIFRTPSQVVIPLDGSTDSELISSTGPLKFVWTDAKGTSHESAPKVTGSGIKLESGEEDLPDFLLFPAGLSISPAENAERYSELQRVGRDREVVSILAKEYEWIKDLSIEVVAGRPYLCAIAKDTLTRLPIASISGGINRMVGILLAVAGRTNAVILVDEIESGVYYKHMRGLWHAIETLAGQNKNQLFLTTHSEEWLEALVAAPAKDLADIALWRMVRTKQGPIIRQFSGHELKAGIQAGGEVR